MSRFRVFLAAIIAITVSFLIACIASADQAASTVPRIQLEHPQPPPLPAQMPPERIFEIQRMSDIPGIRSRLIHIASDRQVTVPSRIEAFELLLKMDAIAVRPHNGRPGKP